MILILSFALVFQIIEFMRLRFLLINIRAFFYSIILFLIVISIVILKIIGNFFLFIFTFDFLIYNSLNIFLFFLLIILYLIDLLLEGLIAIIYMLVRVLAVVIIVSFHFFSLLGFLIILNIAFDGGFYICCLNIWILEILRDFLILYIIRVV